MLGASGGIGQPLSLLLKMSPKVTALKLYDIQHTVGVAADLSHIDTPATVTGYNGPEQLAEALKGELPATPHLLVLPSSPPHYTCRSQTPRWSSFPPACRASRA